MARKALLLAFSFLLVVPVTGAGQPAPVAPAFFFDPNPARGPEDPTAAFMDGGRAAAARHQCAVAANAAGRAVVVWQEADVDGVTSILQRLGP